MELTVEVLRDAEFREGWRGYNPADVDEFIDRISVGVQELQDRIHGLTIRAERAESRLGGENDETVKRTLVLAQRAADLVVSEAKSVAERIVQDAHREAERTISDANAAAAMKHEQSEQEIVRRAGELRAAAEGEHDRLVTQHRHLADEAEQESRLATARAHELHTQAMALRDRFRAALTDQLVRLDRLVEAVEPQGISADGLPNNDAPGGRFMASSSGPAGSYGSSSGAEPIGRYAAQNVTDSSLTVGSEFSLNPLSDGQGEERPDLPTFAPGSGRHSAGPSLESFDSFESSENFASPENFES
jgi:cell division initiation protein